MIDYIPQPPVEARSWLRNNPNTSALAANRFGTTERALAFVDALYARGATEVLVDDPGVDSTGQPYADTLIVKCDEFSRARHRIEQFCEEQALGDLPPGDFTVDRTSDALRLWWD
jgi:hypothetical protein